MRDTAPALYTNDTTPTLLPEMDKPAFTGEQLATFHEDAHAHIRQQAAYCRAHPPIAIYRLATEGSQTRSGGIIKTASSPQHITLPNGQRVCVDKTGDKAVYPDGTTAEIINILQGTLWLVQRTGVPMTDDFLRIAQVR